MTDDFDERHIRRRPSDHDPVATRWMILSLVLIWAGIIGFIVVSVKG